MPVTNPQLQQSRYRCKRRLVVNTTYDALLRGALAVDEATAMWQHLLCLAMICLAVRTSNAQTASAQTLSDGEVSSLVRGIEQMQEKAKGKSVKVEGITRFSTVVDGRELAFEKQVSCVFDGLHGNRMRSVTYICNEQGIPCKLEFGVIPNRRVTVNYNGDSPANANLNCKRMNDRPILDLNSFSGPVIAFGSLTRALAAKESFLISYLRNAKAIVRENRPGVGQVVAAKATLGQWESECVFKMEPVPHCIEHNSWLDRDSGSRIMRRITISYAEQGGALVPSAAVRTISKITLDDNDAPEQLQLRSKTVYSSVEFLENAPDSSFLPAIPGGIPVVDSCNKVAVPQKGDRVSSS